MWKTHSILILVLLGLYGFGIVTLASVSDQIALDRTGDAQFYLKRQMIWLALGAVVCLVTAFIDYRWLITLRWPILGGTVLLLCVVLAMPEVNGARRWINLGPAKLQPSELAKIASLIMLAWWMSKIQRRTGEFLRGFLIPGCFIGLMAGLVVVEPDLGTTMLICAVGFLIMFMAGSNPLYLGLSALGALGVFVSLIMTSSWRMERVFAYLAPFEHMGDKGLQGAHSVYAIHVGGLWGVGPGSSTQKLYFLPEAHTDFIFAIFSEEYGMMVADVVIGLYMIFFIGGMYVSYTCKDYFGKLLAFGITMTITLQALINLYVVTGLFPTKGIALPFFSYGGSHILITSMMVGILFSIARSVREEDHELSLEGSEVWT